MNSNNMKIESKEILQDYMCWVEENKKSRKTSRFLGRTIQVLLKGLLIDRGVFRESELKNSFLNIIYLRRLCDIEGELSIRQSAIRA